MKGVIYMAQPVRMGLVFPRSGQRLFVLISVNASKSEAIDRNDNEKYERTCRSKVANALAVSSVD